MDTISALIKLGLLSFKHIAASLRPFAAASEIAFLFTSRLVPAKIELDILLIAACVVTYEVALFLMS